MAKVKVKGIKTLEATLRKKFEKFVNKVDKIQEGIVGDLKKEIKSGTRYKKNRVISGHAPHKILEMVQQEMLEKSAKKAAKEKDSDSN